ncbi:hypothetical protein BH09PSE6_BH09PSE6_21190 [soil metagenome]
MNVSLQCRCGILRGFVADPQQGNRAVCYCSDCQAFARYLGHADDILDRHGGTEVVATTPMKLQFTQGADALACMSLSPKGLLRWYADCCKTPIGATPRNSRTAYVGLVHNCLQREGEPVPAAFGPIRIHTNVASASSPPGAGTGVLATGWALARIVKALAAARLSGSHRQTPFFTGTPPVPIKAPVVLTLEQRKRLSPGA